MQLLTKRGDGKLSKGTVPVSQQEGWAVIDTIHRKKARSWRSWKMIRRTAQKTQIRVLNETQNRLLTDLVLLRPAAFPGLLMVAGPHRCGCARRNRQGFAIPQKAEATDGIPARK